MSDAPERIWATVNGARNCYPGGYLYLVGRWEGQIPERMRAAEERSIEYIRADLVGALTEQARQAGFAAGVEAAIEAVTLSAWRHVGDDAYGQGMDAGAQHQVKECEKAIRVLTPGATVTLTRERMDAIMDALYDLPEPTVSVALVNRLRAAMKGAVT